MKLRNKLATIVVLTIFATSLFQVEKVEASDSLLRVVEGLQVCQDEVCELYNNENEIIALYFAGIEDGYAIMDVEGNLIEFSYEDDIDDFETDERCYYGGPGNYYVRDKKDKKLVNIATKNKFRRNEIEDFAAEKVVTDLNKNEKSDNKKSTTITYPDGLKDPKGKATYSTINYNAMQLVKKSNLSYATRYFSYNTTGTCGSTASAIFTYYYYDHISTSYIKNSNYKGTTYTKQKNLVNKFKNLIGDDGSGTGYSAVKKGINSYLSSIGKSKNCTYITKLNILSSPIAKIMNCIDAKKPCIVGLSKEPTYGNHWVVGVGYAKYHGYYGRNDGYVYFIKVNNGWYTTKSKSIVYVNYKYVDGCIYLK